MSRKRPEPCLVEQTKAGQPAATQGCAEEDAAETERWIMLGDGVPIKDMNLEQLKRHVEILEGVMDEDQGILAEVLRYEHRIDHPKSQRLVELESRLACAEKTQEETEKRFADLERQNADLVKCIQVLDRALQMTTTTVADKPVSESIRLRTIEEKLAKVSKLQGCPGVELD
jgi:uncharacterized coiled-coil protein SlyX